MLGHDCLHVVDVQLVQLEHPKNFTTVQLISISVIILYLGGGKAEHFGRDASPHGPWPLDETWMICTNKHCSTYILYTLRFVTGLTTIAVRSATVPSAAAVARVQLVVVLQTTRGFCLISHVLNEGRGSTQFVIPAKWTSILIVFSTNESLLKGAYNNSQYSKSRTSIIRTPWFQRLAG